MKAYVLTGYGGPANAEIRDVPEPTPRDRELLIRVASAALNPVDYKFRQGQLRVLHRPSLPVILGSDVAGTVVARGSGATRFEEGARIMARTDELQMGALAEYVCVHEELVATIPERLDTDHGAAMPLAGQTALQVLRDILQVKPGQRILIAGGAGGVGTFAIQIAKELGAMVITTASPRGAALVRRLGADEVIDYTTEDLAQQVSQLDGAFDLIGAKTLRQAFRVVKQQHLVVSIGGMPEPATATEDLGRGAGVAMLFWLASLPLRLSAKSNHVRYRYYFMHSSGSDLQYLAELVEQGRLEPVVDRVYPFDEVGEAFAYLEEGHAKGKVVVAI